MLLSIGEMSKLNNVSIHTLRYYDKIGLLEPSYIDPHSNYRYYDEDDCDKLFQIKIFKSVGISLDEIKQLLFGDINKIQSVYQQTQINIKNQIQELVKISNYIDDELNNIKDYHTKNYNLEPCIKKLPLRQGFVIPVDDTSSFIDRIRAINFFEKSMDSNADVFFKPSRYVSFNNNVERTLKCYLAISRENTISRPDGKTLNLNDGYYGIIDNIGNTNIADSYKKLIHYLNANNHVYSNNAIELIINNNIFNSINIRRTQIQVHITK